MRVYRQTPPPSYFQTAPDPPLCPEQTPPERPLRQSITANDRSDRFENCTFPIFGKGGYRHTPPPRPGGVPTPHQYRPGTRSHGRSPMSTAQPGTSPEGGVPPLGIGAWVVPGLRSRGCCARGRRGLGIARKIAPATVFPLQQPDKITKEYG